jgi:hypothetical protein
VFPVHSPLFLLEVGFTIPCMKDGAERKTGRSLQNTKILQALARYSKEDTESLEHPLF